MIINTVNPATGKIIQTYHTHSNAAAESIIDATHHAFLTWRTLSIDDRAKPMQKMAALLRERKNTYAKLMAEEMGKPITQGMAEVEKCALACDHYIEHADDYLTPREITTSFSKSYVSYQPLGITFGIMPWNFPFWQVFRFAVPNLMAGNGSLLKHAPISTGTALAIEQLFLEAGFPENIFRTLILTNDQAELVIKHPHVTAVTLTGSPRAGKSVAAFAGQHLKKTVLELGGNDPYVVLEDADLNASAETCITARMINTGQSCIAAKRIIAVEAIYDELIPLLKHHLEKYIPSDPLNEKTLCGPLARKDIRETVHTQVQESLKQGARLIMGGEMPSSEGFYYPSTLITDVKKGMPLFDEEVFGPVVAVIKAADENEAITLANDSCYGLGAAVFTQNLARGETIAREKLHSGNCVVNTFVASDPRMPFGGIKASGYGRELSQEGIRSFVNIKTIHIK